MFLQYSEWNNKKTNTNYHKGLEVMVSHDCPHPKVARHMKEES